MCVGVGVVTSRWGSGVVQEARGEGEGDGEGMPARVAVKWLKRLRHHKVKAIFSSSEGGTRVSSEEAQLQLQLQVQQEKHTHREKQVSSSASVSGLRFEGRAVDADYRSGRDSGEVCLDSEPPRPSQIIAQALHNSDKHNSNDLDSDSSDSDGDSKGVDGDRGVESSADVTTVFEVAAGESEVDSTLMNATTTNDNDNDNEDNAANESDDEVCDDFIGQLCAHILFFSGLFERRRKL